MFEQIDQYIGDLKAIKYYDQVKEERDDALDRVDELIDINRDLKTGNKKLTQEKKNLNKKLKDFNKMKKENEDLKNRLNEFEKLKVISEGKSLVEAEEAFLQAMDKEITRRTNKRFRSMKNRWETDKKPKEVTKKAIHWLEHILENLRRPGPKLILKELADVGLPKKVEEIVNSEVGRRLDAEFMKRVEDESNKIASTKLEEKVKIEWPRWFKSVVEPGAKELEKKLIQNSLSLLAGPWDLSCDKCGNQEPIQLTDQEIWRLLRNRFLNLNCPQCTNWIKVSIESLINQRIT